KRGDLARPAVGAEVLENLDRVTSLAFLGGVGILDRLGQPQPAGGVEVNIDRLTNVRIGRDELQFETRRQLDLLFLLLGAQRIGRRHMLTWRPLWFFLLLCSD